MRGLGIYYHIKKNYKEALKWFRISAEQGDADAQFTLGTLYDKDKNYPQDYKEAVKWYTKAAEQGNESARSSLGVMYATGKGVPKDKKEAVKWFRLVHKSVSLDEGYEESAREELKKLLNTNPELFTKQELERNKKQEREAKKKKEKAEQTAKLKRWMVEAENYRSLFKESCAEKEKPSQCITMQSCWTAAIILENMHDDRIKQFKKTVDGGFFSKGNSEKAFKELKKHSDKDKFLKEKIEQLGMQCAFGNSPLSGFVDSFQR
jgi:TPR repeat protein